MKSSRIICNHKYYAKLSYNNRRYYLWDIRSMLLRLYPEREVRRIYFRLLKCPLKRLIEIHSKLIVSIIFNKPFDETVLFACLHKRDAKDSKKKKM